MTINSTNVTSNSVSSLNLIDLDFEYNKADLKSFLRNQDIFKSYDFDGPNINVLIDLLAYNTQKLAFYTNMLFAESFLDSAQLKESVISHAKDLNYTPRSARSPKARIRMSWEATGESQPYIIQKGSSFATVIKNESFVFTMPETVIVASQNTTFSFESDIYEGVYVKDSYTRENSNVNGTVPRYRLTNRNVDTSSIEVRVFEDGDLIGDRYLLKTTLLDLDASSRSFFLQASENGYYEIVFGDNVIGRAPKPNAIIEITYRITKGSRANGARSFMYSFDPTAITGANSELTNTAVVTTLSAANNGSEAESLESIRFYAPRHFQAQERCIVASDYESALMEAYPEISAVSVYGGEDANPPQYGKVFVAVDLRGVSGLPDSKKDEYYRFLRARSPLKPVFVNPKYIYLKPTALVRYNVNVLPVSPVAIETYVKNAISTYNDTYLESFGVEYRHSPFLTMIDNVDAAIISNETDMNVYKKISPLLNRNVTLRVEFDLALTSDLGYLGTSHDATERHTLWSSPFNYQGTTVRIEDDGAGILRLVKMSNTSHDKVTDVGTIDYAAGVVILSNLFVSAYEGDAIKLYARPATKDIIVPKDTIAAIEAAEIEVTAIALKQ